MKNLCICIKKEFFELFKNKKFLLYLCVACIACFIVAKKDLIPIHALMPAMSLLTVCQFLLDTFKTDIKTGGMFFLINTKVNFFILLISKIFVSLVIGFVFVAVFYVATPEPFATFKVFHYIFLMIGITVTTFLSVCLFANADMINFVISMVFALGCFRFSLLINFLFVCILTLICYNSFLSTRFRSFLE
ncbi:MAG: hypothetical protein E7062_03915 [Spirochaetaceae bacterium]|nr:hypothetical protein [Spirochaetaceae bacterium]